MLRVIRWCAVGLIVVLGGLWAGAWWDGLEHGPVPAATGMPGSVSIGGPFTLTDTTGKTVTEADFRGRWMLIYFGYTFCPDVCPTELQAMAASLDQLGPLATQIRPVFITVDPQRDTPTALADYVKLFDDRLVGLTGTSAQIAAVAKAYRVYFARVDAKAGDAYLMDHSSFLYLMGPDGKLRQLIKPGLAGPELAGAIRAVMVGS